MKKKPGKAPYKPTLIDCKLIEVTDPAEWAKLERRVRAAEKAMAQERGGAIKAKPKRRK